MTVKEPPKPPKTQKGKNQKSKSSKHKKKTQSNKTQVPLSENDKKLILELLNQKESSAMISQTEPLITTKEAIRAIGKDPEKKSLQNQVSDVFKLSGWEKLGKRTYQGKQQRVWGKKYLNPTLSQEIKNGGGIVAEVTDTQSISPIIPPTCNQSQKNGQDTPNKSSNSKDFITIPPPKISHQTQPDTAFCDVLPESKIIERNNLELNKVGCTEQNIKDVASMLFDYPEATSVLEEVYEPALIKAAQEVKLKQVTIKILNTIINLWVSNAEKSYMTKVCEGLKEKYGLAMIREACSQSTSTTLGRLLKHIPLVGESLRYRG